MRYGLPAILILMGVVVAVFVINAFEATELMETEQRAAPTMLSR